MNANEVIVVWKPTAAICAAVVVVVAAATFSAGCGGGWDDECDEGYYPPSARDKTMHIYLNISDQDGEPLADVTVWVDGTKQDEKSSDEFSELGNQFPPDWRGWEYNWSGGPFFFDVYRCQRGICRIEVLVSKSGLQSQKTHLEIGERDPDEIYFRQTFVMEPAKGVGTAAVEAPQPAEKTSL